MMIKYIMNKFIFHNSKLNTENFKIKNSFLNPRTNIKSIVDINTLLNKVRLEKKSEKKKNYLSRSWNFIVIFLSKFIVIYNIDYNPKVY